MMGSVEMSLVQRSERHAQSGIRAEGFQEQAREPYSALQLFKFIRGFADWVLLWEYEYSMIETKIFKI